MHLLRVSQDAVEELMAKHNNTCSHAYPQELFSIGLKSIYAQETFNFVLINRHSQRH